MIEKEEQECVLHQMLAEVSVHHSSHIALAVEEGILRERERIRTALKKLEAECRCGNFEPAAIFRIVRGKL